MSQSNRAKVFEGNGTPAVWQRCHQLSCRPGQSIEQARQSYGEEKIAEGDLVVMRTIITPRFDAEGKMIHPRDWPERSGDV